MSIQPQRHPIFNRRTFEALPTERRAGFKLTIRLVGCRSNYDATSRLRAGNAVVLDSPLPGQALLIRQAIATAGLFQGHHAGAHGFNNGGLAPHRPAFGVRWRKFIIKRRNMAR